MPSDPGTRPIRLDRRTWLGVVASGLAAWTAGEAGAQQAGSESGGKVPPAGRGAPTRFQIACMTLPYSRFPLRRALTGIRAAGYRYVAWGTTHQEAGEKVPVVAADAPPDRAKEL